MKIKGFIFDLDGVIVDTAKYHFLAWKKIAEDLNIEFTEIQNEQLKGVSRVQSLEKILSWGEIQLTEAQFQEKLVKKNTDYLNYINEIDESEILPDVERVLSFLKENNQKIALGSASKNAQMILSKIKLLDHFEVIVDGNNVTKAKPNPEVFLNAANQLKIQPIECMVFEDSIAGIEAANTATMTSIGIGNHSALKNAHYVFSDFTEINNNFLLELINK